MTSSSLCCSSSTGWIGNGFVSNQFGFDSNVSGSFRLSSQIKKFNQIPPCEYAHCLSWKTCRRRSEVKSQTTKGQEDSGKFRNEPSDGQQIRKWAELQEHHLLLERRPIVSWWRHRHPSKWWGRGIGVIGEEKGGCDLTAARSARSSRRDGGTGIIGRQSVDVQV